MNLNQRISEVGNHIDKLQCTANKHKQNNKPRLYAKVCETMEDNKKILRELYKDLENSRKRIIIQNIRNEKFNQT